MTLCIKLYNELDLMIKNLIFNMLSYNLEVFDMVIYHPNGLQLSPKISNIQVGRALTLHIPVKSTANDIILSYLSSVIIDNHPN